MHSFGSKGSEGVSGTTTIGCFDLDKTSKHCSISPIDSLIEYMASKYFSKAPVNCQKTYPH